LKWTHAAKQTRAMSNGVVRKTIPGEGPGPREGNNKLQRRKRVNKK